VCRVVLVLVLVVLVLVCDFASNLPQKRRR